MSSESREKKYPNQLMWRRNAYDMKNNNSFRRNIIRSIKKSYLINTAINFLFLIWGHRKKKYDWSDKSWECLTNVPLIVYVIRIATIKRIYFREYLDLLHLDTTQSVSCYFLSRHRKRSLHNKHKYQSLLLFLTISSPIIIQYTLLHPFHLIPHASIYSLFLWLFEWLKDLNLWMMEWNNGPKMKIKTKCMEWMLCVLQKKVKLLMITINYVYGFVYAVVVFWWDVRKMTFMAK